MADVERIIAEQSKCLPDWFYRDAELPGRAVYLRPDEIKENELCESK